MGQNTVAFNGLVNDREIVRHYHEDALNYLIY